MFKKLNIVILLIVLAFPAVMALLVPGFFGASDDLHIAWLYEMDQTIKTGQIPPRFVPDLSYGFGYPLFNFVFPLPFYIGEIFHLLGFSLVDSIKIVFAISVLGSILAMYAFLRKISNKVVGVAGAVLYTYVPYRATDIYDRGAVGESLAFVFLPLIILAVIKTTGSKLSSWKWIAMGSLSIAGLVLSHNITTFMFLPFAFLLGISIAVFDKKFKPFLHLMISFILGLVISSYFWIPALLDSGLVKYDTVFNFVDHFPTILQLIKPYWGYGASVPGPYDGMSFYIGVVSTFVLILSSTVFVLKFKKFFYLEKIIILWGFTCILISVFLMNYRSSFVWSSVPLLPFFQFPWRFLIMITFITPLLLITLQKIKFLFWVGVFVAGASLMTGVLLFKPNDFLGRMDNYYLNRYIPSLTVSQEYQNLQEEYLRLPRDTKQRPDKKYPLVYSEEATPSGRIKNILEKNKLHVSVETSSKEDFQINYTKYYFPGWIGMLDGKQVNLYPGKPFGQITTDVPSGDHKLEIKFQETVRNIVLDIISLLSFVAVISLFLFKKRKDDI